MSRLRVVEVGGGGRGSKDEGTAPVDPPKLERVKFQGARCDKSPLGLEPCGGGERDGECAGERFTR